MRITGQHVAAALGSPYADCPRHWDAKAEAINLGPYSVRGVVRRLVNEPWMVESAMLSLRWTSAAAGLLDILRAVPDGERKDGAT